MYVIIYDQFVLCVLWAVSKRWAWWALWSECSCENDGSQIGPEVTTWRPNEGTLWTQPVCVNPTKQVNRGGQLTTNRFKQTTKDWLFNYNCSFVVISILQALTVESSHTNPLPQVSNFSLIGFFEWYLKMCILLRIGVLFYAVVTLDSIGFHLYALNYGRPQTQAPAKEIRITIYLQICHKLRPVTNGRSISHRVTAYWWNNISSSRILWPQSQPQSSPVPQPGYNHCWLTPGLQYDLSSSAGGWTFVSIQIDGDLQQHILHWPNDSSG